MVQTPVRLMPFKERLKRLRAAAGMTQQELATAAGIAMSAVAQMETGKIINPRLNTVQALAAALKCEVGLLATPDPDEVQPPKTKRKPRGGK
jgi:transcriptional regulator with XRE-family HTH domain